MGGANKQELYCAVQGLHNYRRVQSVTQARGCACWTARMRRPRKPTNHDFKECTRVTMSLSRNLWLGLLALFAVVAAASTPAAAQQQQKPNILFIMGDDIGWMQPSIYHRGLMVGETPNIDRIGNEGAIFMDYVAMQSCTSGRNAFFTGMHPVRTGMIPPQLPGQPVLSATRHPGGRLVPARSRLQHRRVRQEPPGRPHRRRCRPRTASRSTGAISITSTPCSG